MDSFRLATHTAGPKVSRTKATSGTSLLPAYDCVANMKRPGMLPTGIDPSNRRASKINPLLQPVNGGAGARSVVGGQHRGMRRA
jgi:hypothetical protein